MPAEDLVCFPAPRGGREGGKEKGRERGSDRTHHIVICLEDFLVTHLCLEGFILFSACPFHVHVVYILSYRLLALACNSVPMYTGY